MKFKPGDKVEWHDPGSGKNFIGEITIVVGAQCKVIFDGDPNNCEAWIPDYTYYHNSELRKVK